MVAGYDLQNYVNMQSAYFLQSQTVYIYVSKAKLVFSHLCNNQEQVHETRQTLALGF